jgi:hypothetical protein
MLVLLTVVEINIFRSPSKSDSDVYNTCEILSFLTLLQFQITNLRVVEYLLWTTFSARNTGTFALTCLLKRVKSCLLVDLDAITPYLMDRLKKSIFCRIKYVYCLPTSVAPVMSC